MRCSISPLRGIGKVGEGWRGEGVRGWATHGIRHRAPVLGAQEKKDVLIK